MISSFKAHFKMIVTTQILYLFREEEGRRGIGDTPCLHRPPDAAPPSPIIPRMALHSLLRSYRFNAGHMVYLYECTALTVRKDQFDETKTIVQDDGDRA